MPVEIKIDSTDFRVFVGCDLFFDLWWRGKLPDHRGMQPPGPTTSDQRGTAHLHTCWDFPSCEANFEPTPHRSRPDFEQDAAARALFPLPGVQDCGLVPRARRNRRTHGPFLAFGLSFFPIRSPL